MLSKNEIIETINMINSENLDIRTITIGISLFDCICDSINRTSEKIYDKLCKYTENFVTIGDEIGDNYGIPIVNKRIAVTPVSIICGACPKDNPIIIAKTLDKVAKTVEVDFIGGYSALVQKGFTPSDITLINSIPEALASTDRLCSSVNVGSTKSGINLDAVKKMGEIIYSCSEKTKDKNCIGSAKLVVFCNAPDDNPFMAGAFHGVGEADVAINVGISGPGVVCSAIKKAGDCNINSICEVIKNTAFKITRAGQLIANEASKRLNIPFGIVDLSLAPTPAIGDSVARTIEAIGIDNCGGCGTTAILALLNDSVKKGGIMASSNVGGLSGAFIPVSEDEGMIDAVNKGVLSLSKLEAMTSVCSVGLDMIAIPGDTPTDIISGIIADEMAIGMINSKTTAVRLIPAIGKKVGESLSFGGLLGSAPVMEVVNSSAQKFINRGGHIPAPIHSFKN